MRICRHADNNNRLMPYHPLQMKDPSLHCLLIKVAERPRSCRKQLFTLDSSGASRRYHIQPLGIRDLAFGTVWVHPVGTSLVLTSPRFDLGLLVIGPHPPVAIELGMVQPEHRLSGANIHITSGISPNREVSAAVESGFLGRIVLQC